MKNFTLYRPKSVKEALSLLPDTRDIKERENTKLLAGGQDLLTELKERLVEPDHVVNLKGIEGLDRIEVAEDGSVSLGALCTLHDLERHTGLADVFPVLTEAAHSVASAQIRSSATVGGNLCQRPRCWYYRALDAKCLKKGGVECFSYAGANKYNAILGAGPSYIVHPSDLAPALVALDAEVVLVSPRGERRMALDRFFTLPSEGSVLRENVLDSDELVTHVHIPKPPEGLKSTYVKFKERSSYDWALSSVALALVADGDQVTHVRMVLGGVAPIPWRLKRVEKQLTGSKLDAPAIGAAAEAALADAEPMSDNGFKIPLTKGLIKRAFGALQ